MGIADNFIHLHLHSEYSLLDSALKIKPLIEQVKKHNMPAVALTDHGNILGALNFYQEAKRNGIKPLIGSELYIAEESRFSRPNKKKGEINYFHLLALVKNQQGYRNLSELISLSFTEGFYRKPRIDKEVLEKYKDGLIILTACIQGEIAYHMRHDNIERSYEAAKWYQHVFKDDFYIEIQNHGLADQEKILPAQVELAKKLSIPLVATNDVHYLEKTESEAREILICLQTNHIISDVDRPMKKETDEMYLKSGKEMAEIFSYAPESISTSMEIAAKCNFDFKTGKYFLPEFKVPQGMTIDGYFEKICHDGFENVKDSLGHKKHSLSQYKDRLTYEIDAIRQMGFPGYFLIVWDIIKFAKDNNIPVGPGRGSVVGSLVAYVMGITNIDPLVYDLLFERFLNPDRISMPDIDIDFDGERRDEVIEYIRDKYGKNSTAQIVTFGKMKAKMAIRDIGRVLGVRLEDVNRIAKMIPDGPKVKLKYELDNNPDLLKEVKRIDNGLELMDFALKLENNIRHTSMHAAGVVIAPKKLTEFMPLYKTKDDIVTQFEKDEVEAVGLLKMDILGLKTLTIIKNILNEIKSIEKIEIDIDHISLQDKKTYKVFQAGDTDGIFQFESSGMREYLKKSKPDRIEDLIALNALYRPGPLGSGMADTYVNRKLGKEKVSFLFPELEEILKETYGVIVYQEQVMQISVLLAGFSLSKADEMRKIMGKKLTHKLPPLKKEFLAGALKKGYNRKKVEEIFSQMSTFAEYGFNKSHSTAYAFLAYQTAYLKAHFPVYFMSANLTSESSKTSTSSKVIQYISECKKMGIDILPPDVNKSRENFRAESLTSIRFGLMGLKNVGEAAIKSIIETRDSIGLFTDYSDFIKRVDMTKVNKAVLESLVKSGAFDCFNIKRRSLFESVEDIIKQAAIIERNRQKNQRSLFSGENVYNGIVIKEEFLSKDEWNEQEITQGEKEITGIYISHNPLEKYRNEIKKVSNTNIVNLKEFKGDRVKLGGVITDFKQRKSKKGNYYGELFFEDLTGRTKILVFSREKRWNGQARQTEEVASWDSLKDTIKLDFPYYLEGRKPDDNEANSSIYLENLVQLDTFLKKKASKIIIKLNYEQLNDEFNEKLNQKILNNRDSVPYIFLIDRADGYRTLIQSAEKDYGLKATVSMKRDIEKLTGENTVEIIY